ncbi:response regulator [Oryzomonas sagensis]|uniref:Response regulator n=1 Tax=Oryzomonas sagensis TaxID=2603857 RepID=A0ABQ6TLV8_9BACT|nr:response regulator [Oryzomonas sagensis]KAB0669407.1 response regulator [Oryzomonas sagensis]
MKCLIVEDDFISRRILKEMLSKHFDCDIAINGEEAVTSFRLAHEGKHPYDLICMDIMMPGVNGQEALRRIRELERSLQVPPQLEAKVIMTTALDDPQTVVQAFYKGGATAYLVKPIGRQKLMNELRVLGLL